MTERAPASILVHADAILDVVLDGVAREAIADAEGRARAFDVSASAGSFVLTALGASAGAPGGAQSRVLPVVHGLQPVHEALKAGAQAVLVPRATTDDGAASSHGATFLVRLDRPSRRASRKLLQLLSSGGRRSAVGTLDPAHLFGTLRIRLQFRPSLLEPPSFSTPLRPYQRNALAWMAQRERVLPPVPPLVSPGACLSLPTVRWEAARSSLAREHRARLIVRDAARGCGFDVVATAAITPFRSGLEPFMTYTRDVLGEASFNSALKMMRAASRPGDIQRASDALALRRSDPHAPPACALSPCVLLVCRVDPAGPAAAFLRVGDVLVEFDGTPLFPTAHHVKETRMAEILRTVRGGAARAAADTPGSATARPATAFEVLVLRPPARPGMRLEKAIGMMDEEDEDEDEETEVVDDGVHRGSSGSADGGAGADVGVGAGAGAGTGAGAGGLAAGEEAAGSDADLLRVLGRLSEMGWECPTLGAAVAVWRSASTLLKLRCLGAEMKTSLAAEHAAEPHALLTRFGARSGMSHLARVVGAGAEPPAEAHPHPLWVPVQRQEVTVPLLTVPRLATELPARAIGVRYIHSVSGEESLTPQPSPDPPAGGILADEVRGGRTLPRAPDSLTLLVDGAWQDPRTARAGRSMPRAAVVRLWRPRIAGWRRALASSLRRFCALREGPSSWRRSRRERAEWLASRFGGWANDGRLARHTRSVPAQHHRTVAQRVLAPRAELGCRQVQWAHQ